MPRPTGAALRVALLGAALATTLAAAAPAPAAAERLTIVATAWRVGLIDLFGGAAPGQEIVLGEVVRGRQQEIGRVVSPGDYWGVPAAALWRCDRRVRRFRASARGPDGQVQTDSFKVLTPSCRARLRLDAPRTAEPGATALVRVRDHWAIGHVRARLCVTPPHAGPRCERVGIPAGQDLAETSVSLGRRGLWQIELVGPARRLRRTIAVGVPAPRRKPAARLPRILMTGDSMMYTLEAVLGERLAGRARPSTEIRAATGLSRPGFDWVPAAFEDAAHYRPRAVVMFIGAGDGFPLTTATGATASCCSQDWVAEYRRRVVAMVENYERGGTTRVVWLNLPAARRNFRAQLRAVNTALRQAESSTPALTVVDVAKKLTPGFVYRESMRVRGRRVRLRAHDRVHLALGGARVTAPLVIRALERAGVIAKPSRRRSSGRRSRPGRAKSPGSRS